MDEINKTFILVDTSYWIFYRYFALLQWWNHAKPDDKLGEDPYENEEFVEKFIKTFTESLEGFKKKQKLHKQRGKQETSCIIIACQDCPRKEIWRNKYYDRYKETRIKDDSFMGGPFFKLAYSNQNKMLYDSGVNRVLRFPNLEADDIIAIAKYGIRTKYPFAKIIIIANDHDYLQLVDENTDIINFQHKKLQDAKKVFTEPEKNLFFKIVLGDKSDNIMPIFKKCGTKTCEKYYENKDLFNEALKKESGALEKYKLNKKLVSFSEIPEEFICGLISNNKEIFENI